MVVAFGFNSEPDVIPDLMGIPTYVAIYCRPWFRFLSQPYLLLHPPLSSAVPSLRGLPIVFGKSSIS